MFLVAHSAEDRGVEDNAGEFLEEESSDPT
jgi:hypothetical protein